MKKLFKIVNDVIENVAIFDDDHEFNESDGLWVDANEINGIGDSYNKETQEFIKAPETVSNIPETISDRQFFQQLAVEGLITEEEAIEAVKNGTLPSAFENLITSLSSTERFNARMLLSGATEFRRSHPIVEAFRVYLNYEIEAVNHIWIEASKL